MGPTCNPGPDPPAPASITAPHDSPAMTPTPASDPSTVTLQPRFWVPLGVMGLGGCCLVLLPIWAGAPILALVVTLFGVFLMVQAFLLRLQFSDEALLVLRRQSVIREFPYGEWINWRVFWPPLPVLFYFREQASVHLLPMLFDANVLREQLQQRLNPGVPPAP